MPPTDELPCASQHRFTSWQAASAYARWYNLATDYARPITRERCRRCDGWHVVRVHTARQRRHVEKERRKWRAMETGEPI